MPRLPRPQLLLAVALAVVFSLGVVAATLGPDSGRRQLVASTEGDATSTSAPTTTTAIAPTTTDAPTAVEPTTPLTAPEPSTTVAKPAAATITTAPRPSVTTTATAAVPVIRNLSASPHAPTCGNTLDGEGYLFVRLTMRSADPVTAQLDWSGPVTEVNFQSPPTIAGTTALAPVEAADSIPMFTVRLTYFSHEDYQLTVRVTDTAGRRASTSITAPAPTQPCRPAQ